MGQFHHHYSLQEARKLIPQVRKWLEQMDEVRKRLEHLDKRLEGLLAVGDDLGGTLVNQWIRSLADLKEFLYEFESREIQIKDLDRGLIDFPSMRGGKEIFLCWEKDEEDIQFWHDLETGFSGREPIE